MTTHHMAHEGLKVNTSDSVVVVAGAAALTSDWWNHLVEWIPSVMQVGITTGTLIFVLFRAASEVRKFWRNREEERETHDS